MSKKRIALICPGRGSYTKDNLGYLINRPEIQQELRVIDEYRQQWGLPTISQLDSEKTFRTNLHTKGEHASPLIFACAMADFLAIDRERFEVVAIAGNSMGWYLALAFAESLSLANAFQVIQTMGSMMSDGLIGGQIIYPIVDEQWQIQDSLREMVFEKMDQVTDGGGGDLYLSIELGGYLVIGGDQEALSRLQKALPPVEHFPFQLVNHSAFHTPLLQAVSQKAFAVLPQALFDQPRRPLVDGRGHIWQPHATEIPQIHGYTLGHQVYKPYDFTLSVEVVLKEFAPDHLVLLGPGNSLGGALGQILIKNQWRGIASKAQFTEMQKLAPFLLSFGIEEQREMLVRK